MDIEQHEEVGLSYEFYVPGGILWITLPQHIGAVFACYFLIVGEASPIWLIGTYLSWIAIGVFGIGIFFHKYFAHKGFQTYRPIEAIGAYLGCLAGLGPPIGWVALHNDHHHRYSDKSSLDVHSPIHGKFHAYMGWQFQKFELKLSSARRLVVNPVLRFLGGHYYQTYWITGLVLFAVSPMALIFLLLLPGFIHYHIEGVISCFCHLRNFGYRNFETSDDSVNIWLLGILTWGAGFHNNHHGNPTRPHNQERIHEIDFSRLLLLVIPKRRGHEQ